MMKMQSTILVLLFLFISKDGMGQSWLSAPQKRLKTYVQFDPKSEKAYLYDLWAFFPGGAGFRGHRLAQTDTLYLQADGGYVGKISALQKNTRGQWDMRLIRPRSTLKKTLVPAPSDSAINRDLNHAYYMKQYFAMCSAVPVKYPGVDPDYYNGMDYLANCPNRQLPFADFRAQADTCIQRIQDSICHPHQGYSARMEYLLQHFTEMPFPIFRDSLLQLPLTSNLEMGYFRTVSAAVAKQQPATFFELWEALPGQRSTLYWAVQADKATIKALAKVQGHETSKKAFFKKHRKHKVLGPLELVPNIIGLGLIIWLIAR